MVTGELNSEHPQEELKSLDLSKNIIPSDTAKLPEMQLHSFGGPCPYQIFASI